MIKKAAMAAFVFALFIFSAKAYGGGIENEYWNWDNATPKALVFENYFFSDDGTFRYSWGYSGNSYSGGWYSGTYFYDAVKNKIFFNTTDNGVMGSSEKAERPAPKELAILEFLDNDAVKIDIKAAHEKNSHNLFDGVMKRYKGRIKDQVWQFAHYSLVREFSFDPQGNCFYKEGKQNSDSFSSYECEYGITGGVLFLKVKSAHQNGLSAAKYEPPVKTYIRLGKSASGEILVENAGFAGILTGSRNWDYANGEYKIKTVLAPLKQKDLYLYRIDIQGDDTVSSLSETAAGEITIY